MGYIRNRSSEGLIRFQGIPLAPQFVPVVPHWWHCLGNLEGVALLDEMCHWRQALRV